MVSAIVTAIIDACTSFVTGFGGAVVDGFEALIWDASGTTPALTSLGTGLLVFAGIGLGISAFYLVFNLLRSRIAKRA